MFSLLLLLCSRRVGVWGSYCLAESGTETSSSAFEDTETPPFVPSSEWGESTALGEGALGDSQLSYYSEDGVRDGPAGVVDDEWVQGLYDMEGMS